MANEKLLIDAEWLKAKCYAICDEYNTERLHIDRIIDEIDDAPAVEVVHGYWDDSGRYQFPSGRIAIRCSICGCALSKSEYNLFNWNYCPVCGAKMDGGVKNA